MTHQLAALRAELATVGIDRFTSPDYRPGAVTHLVILRFRREVSDEQQRSIARAFLDLATSPRDGEPYILSLSGGRQASGEPSVDLDEWGFVVRFASLGDRNYYVGSPVFDDADHWDREHERFKQRVGPLLDDVVVLDFTESPADI
jgi:hypothetical protein